jgi:hypothetical protein
MSVTLRTHIRQFATGVYKTQMGYRAVVAQMRVQRQEGMLPRFYLIGAVVFAGIHVIHKWYLDGKSTSDDTRYDLVRAE